LGVTLCAVGSGALVVMAVHGEQAVQALQTGKPVANTKLDGPDFGSYVTLLKAVGSRVTLASHQSRSTVDLALNDASGPGTCLGTIVVAHEPGPDGVTTTVGGSGASLPGKGPVPPTPL